MGVFVYCYTATGKSTVGRKYSNVIDMESTLFKYVNTKAENEQDKGTIREIDKDYPANYFDALMSVKDKYDYILISDSICNEWLKKYGFPYWQVYPSIELKDEYLQRMKERGNNADFINYQEKLWEIWVNGCKNDKHAEKHIELKSGQHVEDVLPGLKLRTDNDRIY